MSNSGRIVVPRVVAVCRSSGGIPKLPVQRASVLRSGIDGDLHAHAKHNRPDRALSLFDMEILQQLVEEGYPLVPGAAGENLTVEGLDVQRLRPGTLLQIGSAIIRLETPRKPCYVLDSIDPRLKEAIAGRCGYMASVVREGTIACGMPIQIGDEEICGAADPGGTEFSANDSTPFSTSTLTVCPPYTS